MSNHNTATKSFTIPDRWDSFLTDKLLTFTSDLGDPNLKLAELMRYALLKAFPELEEIENAKNGTLSRDYLIEQSRIFDRLLQGQDMTMEWRNLQRRLKSGEFSRKL